MRVWALGMQSSRSHAWVHRHDLNADGRRFGPHTPLAARRRERTAWAVYLPAVQVYLDRSTMQVYLDLELADSQLDQVTCLR